MYFPDFTPYCYGTFLGPDRVISLDEVRMIGWLENGHEFSKGQVDEQILSYLRELLIMSPRTAIGAKGFHFCDFCPPRADDWYSRPRISFWAREISLGGAQIWLPSAKSPNLIYAAPNLIYHYIVEHGYRPPDEFLDAFKYFDIDSEWDASEQKRAILEKTRERIRKEEQSKGQQ